jgi:hypothetical protein
MEKEKYNGDVFEMVNNYERQQAIRKKYSDHRKRKNMRICNWAIASGIVSLFFGLMGITGAMIVWVATPIFSFFGMLAAFLAGRWFENGKCLGWK